MTATWFSGLLLNFGTISPFSLVSPGPLSATKKEICFVGRYQLRYAGKTFSVLSRPTDGSEFFGRCAAQALIQRRIIAVFFCFAAYTAAHRNPAFGKVPGTHPQQYRYEHCSSAADQPASTDHMQQKPSGSCR